MRVKLLALAAAAALGAGTANAALLTNGDFEAPTAPYSLPPGWTGSTSAIGGPMSAPNLFVVSGSDYVACCGVTGSAASFANRFATFGAGDSPHAGGVLAQSFATTVGQTYLLSFPQATLGADGTQTLRVRIRDESHDSQTALQDFTVFTGHNLDTAFTLQTLAFTATGTTSQLRLENISPVTANIDAVVDDFAITPRAAVDSSVPEPAAWALMLGGFALSGAALRLRRRAAFAL